MAPRRSGRRSMRSAVQRTPTPVEEPADSEMIDAPAENLPLEQPPQEDAGLDEDHGNEEEDGEEDGGDEDEAHEGGDEDDGSSMPAASPAPASRGRDAHNLAAPAASSIPEPPVKRRPGRPPKYPRPPISGSDREGSDGTPRRGRGGWRGGRGFGGGRWKNKNLQRQQMQPTDRDGEVLEIEDDEAKMPDDAAGEKKVDRRGYLQGGREYRVRTFTIDGRDKRLYMLSTEPARCIGFRDSYLFFQKHRMLYKIILSDDEKLDLIERDLMPHSYKGRTIGVVTARSVFREFGAQIIIRGRKITDDYREADMRAEGSAEGEIAVPDDVLPGPGEEYDRNRYVAWHGASQVYHTTGPAIPAPSSRVEAKKRKVVVTGSNWMLEHAREASRFNSSLAAARRDNLDGVYDIYTNQMHYPSHMQSTHAKWEQLYESASIVHTEHAAPKTSAGDVNGIHVNSDPPTTLKHSNESQTNAPDGRPDSAAPLPIRSFLPPSEYQMRNFATVDHVYISPRYSGLGNPGQDGHVRRFPGEGQGLADVEDHILESLPEECRKAFEEAKRDEINWRATFATEKEDGMRAMPRIKYIA